jgi:hypothetical protein
LKVELSQDDLQVTLLALEGMTIKGKDAPVIAKLLLKISKAFEKSVS